MHADSSLLTGGQQRGIISPFGAMHAGSSLLTGGQQRGIISPFGAMHAGSSLLTDGQQRGIISPFGAMHAGSSLLTGGQQRGIISPFGAMHAGSSLLTGGQQRGIISPFGAMHAGSSLLTDGQQRGIISPFGAMHAGSYLLARQPRGVLSLWGVMPLFIPLADGIEPRHHYDRCNGGLEPVDVGVRIVEVFGDSTPEVKVQSEVRRSVNGTRKTDQKETKGHGDPTCMVCPTLSREQDELVTSGSKASTDEGLIHAPFRRLCFTGREALVRSSAWVVAEERTPSEGHTGWYTEKHIDSTVVNVGVSSDNDGPERTPRSMPENIPAQYLKFPEAANHNRSAGRFVEGHYRTEYPIDGQIKAMLV
ncbi:hypothetical protein Tco_0793790 [Tanacetum coccineum]